MGTRIVCGHLMRSYDFTGNCILKMVGNLLEVFCAESIKYVSSFTNQEEEAQYLTRC